jgi:hypothetical protein
VSDVAQARLPDCRDEREVAREVRAALWRAFPGVRFSIRPKELCVNWTDGPGVDEVKDALVAAGARATLSPYGVREISLRRLGPVPHARWPIMFDRRSKTRWADTRDSRIG